MILIKNKNNFYKKGLLAKTAYKTQYNIKHGTYIYTVTNKICTPQYIRTNTQYLWSDEALFVAVILYLTRYIFDIYIHESL